jgi:SecD/SecF fusion protein
MNRQLLWRGLLVVGVTTAAAALAFNRPPRLGLDLKGGSQIVLEADSARADSDAVSRTLEVLRRRVDQLGVAEPSLQRSGENRILVELPGLSDPQRAVEVIGRTAQLEFRPVLGLETAPPVAVQVGTPEEPAANGGSDGGEVLTDEDGQPLRFGAATVSGEAVRDGSALIDSASGGWHVQVEFTSGGAGGWSSITGAAACSPLETQGEGSQ